MLSREQAAQIAEELVEQKRGEAAELRDAKAGHVAFIYRSAALRRLRPRHQSEVLRLAKQEAMGSWLANAIVLGSAGGGFALLTRLFGSVLSSAAIPGLVITVSVAVGVRAVQVRRAASRLAVQFLQGGGA